MVNLQEKLTALIAAGQNVIGLLMNARSANAALRVQVSDASALHVQDVATIAAQAQTILDRDTALAAALEQLALSQQSGLATAGELEVTNNALTAAQSALGESQLMLTTVTGNLVAAEASNDALNMQIAADTNSDAEVGVQIDAFAAALVAAGVEPAAETPVVS
jgi:hypothetical protein